MNAIFEEKTYFQLKGCQREGLRESTPMFHPHGELLFVQEGTAQVTVEGKDYCLGPGEGLVIFPYLPHFYAQGPEVKALILLFDPLATAFDATLVEKKPSDCRIAGKELELLLSRAIIMLEKGKRKTAMGYFNAVLGECLEQLTLERRENSAGDISLQLLRYCGNHFMEDITVKSIAQALYISESYVTKVFSQKLKIGFRTYINDLRMHKAQSLLEESDEKIQTIMERCGFQNQSSFNRVFRGITGLSPRQYRKAFRNK